MNPPLPLSNPVVGVTLRSIFGAYVIFMARRFYANPTGYFRKSMRALPDLPWLAPVVRAMAFFCLWGGCFIVATAFAVQVFGLHGDVLGLALALMAGLATWLLLPKRPVTDWEDDSSGGHPDGFS